MKETKLQPNELDIIQANEGMKLYLRGLSTGKDFTPRSSLYNIEGKTRMLEPDEILAAWQEHLAKLQNGSTFEQEVFQFDSRQLEKWGPQGGVAPIDDLLEEIVSPTFEPKSRPTAFSTREWQVAKKYVSKCLFAAGCKSLRPVSYTRVVDDMRARDTLESNSGWPLFTRRNKPEVIRQSIEEAEDGRWKTYPAIALFRNYNRKTRLVWMFPMSANLVEGSFFQPLQSILMKSVYADKFLAPWKGFETVRSLVTDSYNSGLSIAASDFSSTDAHFTLDTSLEVYDVIAPCFQPAYRDLLKESILRMHSIPLVIGEDRQIVGEHGVSSGSNWTNFIETIFDWIFSTYVALNEGGRKNVLPEDISSVYSGLYAIGDDMSWTVRRDRYDAEFSERLEALGKSVGQIIKAEKTTNDPDKVKSLQRLFIRGYLREDQQVRAVYPSVRALKSLVYPERMHKKRDWSRDMAAIRAVMILENCVDHPLYTELVAFVAQGDPHLVEFAKFSSTKQNALFRQSKLVPGLNSTYNQERRNSAISQFRTIQVLREL